MQDRTSKITKKIIAMLLGAVVLTACNSPSNKEKVTVQSSEESKPSARDAHWGASSQSSSAKGEHSLEIPSAFRSLEAVSPAEWTTSTRMSEYVTMRDGVKLAVDINLPSGYTGEGEAPTSFPIVFMYTPYHRNDLNLKTGRIGSFHIPRPDLFLSRGYAVVSADMRGTGASFGWNATQSKAIRVDGKELIDWMAGQEWSTGKVGMFGISYQGWSQLASASEKPQALKAIVPTNSGMGSYTSRPGGIFAYNFLGLWSAITDYMNQNVSAGNLLHTQPAVPVVDEDGDGELHDEIPVDFDKSGYFTDDYPWPVDPSNPPQYPDGVERQDHFYFNATSEHIKHPDGAPGNYDAPLQHIKTIYYDQQRPSDQQTSNDVTWGLLDAVAESGVAVYSFVGWFDGMTSALLDTHSRLAEKSDAQLVIWPSYHGSMRPKVAAHLGADGEIDVINSVGYFAEHLRWFDRWLKGIDNGIEKEAPVKLFVMNKGWRFEESWPLEREERTKFYFGKEASLTNNRPEMAIDQYEADYTNNSQNPPFIDSSLISNASILKGREPFKAKVYGHSRSQMIGSPSEVPFRTQAQNASTLSYTSEPLEGDTEVTGYPVVDVWVSSTADYGDLFFYLEDVDPEGNTFLVTDFQNRVGFNTHLSKGSGESHLHKNPVNPSYSFSKNDYTDRVFADGKLVNVRLSLHPTSWVFKKGHKIRLSIAGSDWPTFELHPKLSPSNDPDAEDNIVPTLSFVRGGELASLIDLPVIPN